MKNCTRSICKNGCMIPQDCPEDRAQSVEQMPESREMQVVAAVTTGSLPVWWRELFPLIEKWEEKAKGYANDAKYHEYRGSSELRREYNALWSAHKSCAEELRRQMAAAIKRQPEENNKVSQPGI